MIEIKDLLARYKNILSSEGDKVDAIKNALYQTIGVQIKSEDIHIKNNTVYLNIKPIYKNEILLKREEVSALLEQALGKKTPKSIR